MPEVCQECGEAEALPIPAAPIAQAKSEDTGKVYMVHSGIREIGVSELPKLCVKCVDALMRGALTEEVTP